MDPISLGLVLAMLGMGGTLLTLFVISLLMSLLKRLFPYEAPARSGPNGPAPTPTPPSSPGAM